jgi:hypothetical protein
MRRLKSSALLITGLVLAGCGGTDPPSTPGQWATAPTSAESSAADPVPTTAEPTAGQEPSTSARSSAQHPTPTTAKKPPGTTTAPKKPPPVSSKPPAKGSPVRTVPIEILNSSYADSGPGTRSQLIQECGGTLCVTIKETIEGPPNQRQDCNVNRIIQPVPLYPHDTITFVLSDPCGGFPPDPPTTS